MSRTHCLPVPAEEDAAEVARARALLDGAARVLCDLDGCLISGRRVLPGVGPFLADCGARLRIVSNNSTDTADSLSRRLAGMGLQVPPARIVLAGEVALRLAQRIAPGGPIRLLAGPTMAAFARTLGLRPQGDAPQVIVLCRDATRAQIEAALPNLAAGVPLIVANPDLTHPGEAGPVIETGALLALLAACVPGQTHQLVGKPGPRLFQAALAGIAPERAVMFGDNPDTDVAGARALGIAQVLVGGSAAGALAGFDRLYPAV